MISSRSPRHNGSRVCELFKARVDDLLGGQLGVDRVHLGPVHHDVRHGQLAQIEHAAQHVAGELHHAAFLMMQLDGAPDLLMRREHFGVVADRDAEQAQGVPDDPLHGGGYRRQHRHDETHGGRDGERHAVGVQDRVGLGQHLGEQHHDHRHDDGRVDHALFAKQGQEQAGGERGRGDVGERVAEQDGADEALAYGEQVVHHARAAAASLLERMHLGGGGCGQGCLGAGEEGRGEQETQDCAKRNTQA